MSSRQLPDSGTNVYIDNNVWDFLFERKLDLSVELPRPEWCLCLTREAEFEIPPIPPEKAELKAFIQNTIERCGVKTHSFFGFYDDRHPSNEQRVGGWGVGHWASKEELAFIEQQKTRLSSEKKSTTGLYKNEADISLAARAFNSVVISLDSKAGPINDAYRRGKQVVFLTDFDHENHSLATFIKSRLVTVHSTSETEQGSPEA